MNISFKRFEWTTGILIISQIKNRQGNEGKETLKLSVQQIQFHQQNCY